MTENRWQAEDPYEFLGISVRADEATIRQRYLELVKQFPPDREPEKFRAVQSAYEAIRDPLAQASRLLNPDAEPAQWAEVFVAARAVLPSFNSRFLLSLGNQVVVHGDS